MAKLVETLLEHKADVNKADGYGKTPLSLDGNFWRFPEFFGTKSSKSLVIINVKTNGLGTHVLETPYVCQGAEGSG